MNATPPPNMKRVFLAFLLTCSLQILAAGTAGSGEQPDLKSFVGEWVRPDGGYVIHVRDVKPDGSVDAGYFNPGEINVVEAYASVWKGLNKLFIKLQDKEYPGSTYTLYYYPEKDAMAGFYYQATMGKTFEVVFMRK